MELTASITSVLLICALAWQDFKSRSITAWLLPAAGLLLVIAELFHTDMNAIWLHAGINLVLLMLQFLLLSAWISIRSRKLTNIVDSHIGLGDCLFLICMAPVLSPLNFCLLLTGGTFLSLLVHLMIRLVNPDSDSKIPLAGYLGVVVLTFFLLNLCGIVQVRLSDGEWLNSYLMNQSFTK